MPKPILVLQDDKFIITKVPGLQREHEWACCSSFHTTFPSEKTVQSQSRRESSWSCSSNSRWNWGLDQWAVSLAHVDETDTEDTLCYKYIAAYLFDGKPFFYLFPSRSKAETALCFFIFCFCAPSDCENCQSLHSRKTLLINIFRICRDWLTRSSQRSWPACDRTNTLRPCGGPSEKNMKNVILPWHLSAHFICRRPAAMAYIMRYT